MRCAAQSLKILRLFSKIRSLNKIMTAIMVMHTHTHAHTRAHTHTHT